MALWNISIEIFFLRKNKKRYEEVFLPYSLTVLARTTNRMPAPIKAPNQKFDASLVKALDGRWICTWSVTLSAYSLS